MPNCVRRSGAIPDSFDRPAWMEGFQRRIEPFQKQKHSRDTFTCEIESLERYFRTQAAQDVDSRVAAVFVLAEGLAVLGYYTLSSYTIEPGELPKDVIKRLPRYPKLPAVLIGRLARDAKHARQGIGEILLVDALRRSLHTSVDVGAAAVVVEAENDKARRFYLDYGFISFPKQPNKLFLPMRTIEKLFA